MTLSGEALDIYLKTSTHYISTGLTGRALGHSFRSGWGRCPPNHPRPSGDHPAKDPGKTQHNPLPPAKPERTRAVPGLTASISLMENIDHMFPEAAWDTVKKHREGAAMALGEL